METQPTTTEAVEKYARFCNDYCERAEKILQNQEDTSPITAMALHVLEELRAFRDGAEGWEYICVAAMRLADMLTDHPRLALQLKDAALERLQKVEHLLDNEDRELRDDVRRQADVLRANILAADEGRWADIITSGHLKHDPVEWTKAYEDVIDEAEQEAYSYLKDVPRGMGFCFAYWAEKRKALAKRGIEWNSPSAMNPGVLFD